MHIHAMKELPPNLEVIRSINTNSAINHSPIEKRPITLTTTRSQLNERRAMRKSI